MSDFVQILKRRDTAAAWTAANPVLAAGEDGYEIDTGKGKTGNGTTAWTALPYNSGVSSNTVSFVDILGEVGTNVNLAAALTGKISSSARGAANGIAPLGATLKIDEIYLPDGLEKSANKGIAGGYAGLDSEIRVPDANLPLNIERTTRKGAAGGYAGLDAGGKISTSTLPGEVQLKADKGNPLGYAPLNSDGKVPAEHLPVVSGGSGGAEGAIPHGVIVMWSGTLLNIPDGWALCDGYNGTPNLLDRFIVSVPSSNTNPGATGGAHEKVLVTNNLPSHSHTFTGNGHTHDFTGGIHSHQFSATHSHGLDAQHDHVFGIDEHYHHFSCNTSTSEHRHNMPDLLANEYSVVVNSPPTSPFGGGFSGVGKLGVMGQELLTNIVGHHHTLGGNTSATPLIGRTAGISRPLSVYPSDAAGTTASTPTAGTVNTAQAGGTISSTGSGTAFDARPKYYALAFIMKL